MVFGRGSSVRLVLLRRRVRRSGKWRGRPTGKGGWRFTGRCLAARRLRALAGVISCSFRDFQLLIQFLLDSFVSCEMRLFDYSFNQIFILLMINDDCLLLIAK